MSLTLSYSGLRLLLAVLLAVAGGLGRVRSTRVLRH